MRKESFQGHYILNTSFQSKADLRDPKTISNFKFHIQWCAWGLDCDRLDECLIWLYTWCLMKNIDNRFWWCNTKNKNDETHTILAQPRLLFWLQMQIWQQYCIYQDISKYCCCNWSNFIAIHQGVSYKFVVFKIADFLIFIGKGAMRLFNSHQLQHAVFLPSSHCLINFMVCPTLITFLTIWVSLRQ